MIVTSNITMQFGAKPLFENVNAKFGDGNRYGLIGANGCGKSTFMKILSGELAQSSGEVAIDKHERVGNLSQDQFAFEHLRVLDVVMMGHRELWAALSERDAIYANLEASEDDYMRAADLEAKVAEYDGYSAAARAGELLGGVGIAQAQHEGLMSEIAPGFKLRVLLAQALFSNPDILLLDEPTNNLDINTIRWLENILDSRQSTMIIISHDRHFLNQVCTHMADLDYGKLQVFPGNYDEYMMAAMQAKEQANASNARAKDRISDLQDFVRRFSANKSKARQATSRVKQVAKLKSEMIEVKPSSRQYPFIRFDFDEKEKLHRLAVEVEKLSMQFAGQAKPLFSNINLMVEAGEKIAIIGPNGVGKTTLLRLLAGELAPTYGKIKWAEKANLGYFAQDHAAQFAEPLTLFDWLSQYRPTGDDAIDDQAVRGILGRLLFNADDIRKAATVISGGEEGRMLFGKLMLEHPNVLLMDEPTNHMDMESIESLNTALEKYKGTLIFVSHDREFVSSLATRIIEMTPTGVNDYHGTYEEYLATQGIEA